jgi:hypothetical protein
MEAAPCSMLQLPSEWQATTTIPYLVRSVLLVKILHHVISAKDMTGTDLEGSVYPVTGSDNAETLRQLPQCVGMYWPARWCYYKSP